MARRFGVFLEDTGHPRRSTFVLDRQGTVRWTYHAELDEQRDVTQIISALEEIEGSPAGGLPQ
ncbi:MAG: hypothetical protein Kow00129_06720 [Thermoleophilia bacterium]